MRNFLRGIILLLFISGIIFAQENVEFVEVIKVNPNIILDIRYATENNFLKRSVYPEARCFVRKKVAVQLDSIQNELETIGLGLKIFDGYRPLSVQRQMWEILPDSRYVANPANGSRHNRGSAVDVTLVDSTGTELSMPTEFDDFTERAHQDYLDLSSEVRRNRWILRNIMEKYGFSAIDSEWWHYDLKGWEVYTVTDLSFEDIEAQNR